MLQAGILVLYDSTSDTTEAFRLTGAVYIRSGVELRAGGYPSHVESTAGTGSMYLCLELGEPIDFGVTGEVARLLGDDDGSPTSTTWAAIARNSV